MGMMRISSQTIRHDVHVLNYVILVHAAFFIIAPSRSKSYVSSVLSTFSSGSACTVVLEVIFISPPIPHNSVDDVIGLIILTA